MNWKREICGSAQFGFGLTSFLNTPRLLRVFYSHHFVLSVDLFSKLIMMSNSVFCRLPFCDS